MSKRQTGFGSLGGLVFSTDAGRMCPDCRQPMDACICGQPELPAGDGIARVRRETKGRGGKTVTTISGLLLPADELKTLAKRIKARCGCGGSVVDGVIEIQGDRAEMLCQWLIDEGFQAKRSGG
ncbi:translation initiation factor [Pseudomonas saudimassiliensis]|uniref:Translation initiation factor n=1 Tax=Pseudomonas saudimassiliensis TaxID=1461581 RepID=A0A078MMY4_9PSED|nr:translation initiation factor Sui1 [Pseudomonas saudimassiliensis]CEA06131.1 translation initiation factor [Pseudomonas saudimassiliensis]CEF27556.1 translation initiation factor [Pseudomonas saudimassiliensis]